MIVKSVNVGKKFAKFKLKNVIFNQ